MKISSLYSFAKTTKRIALAIIAFLLACLLVLAGLLWLWSPGNPTPFLDEHGSPLAGSISEKTHVSINGVQQGMFIKSRDSTNPVLLYLHGGMPEYFLTQNYPTGLEKHFTVCWWEQRGSGLSYSSDTSAAPVTAEQLIADVLEVTKYLLHRFGKEKIYLMAHSGGSFIGIQAAARAPELYYAYIGMAQISRQLKSETLAYEYMLEQFKKNGNISMVRRLEAAPVTMTNGVPDSYHSLRDESMHALGVGTTHGMKSVMSGIFLPSLQFREYTLSEKINLWRGKFRTGVSPVWNEILAADLTRKVPRVEIPIYFFHGIYDYTVSYGEAKSYFELLRAPSKGFYTFERSAHSPLFEEPERALKILQENVFVGSNSLTDAK
jgi:pimeloyl-ACP methyl ester carboxylesterase